MAGITGQGTSYNLPNFVGELFAASPEDTPFLSAIGGLTGGEESNGSTIFTWQGYDLRSPDATRQRLEGAAAPTAEERVRYNASNVLEIHQETVEVSYTKQAANGQVAAISGAQANQVGVTSGGNPVADEMTWQTTQAIKQVARDVNLGFLTGTHQNPADNTTARKTRGILSAITTNAVVAPDGDGGTAGTQPSALTEDMVLDLMQTVWANGGIQESETRTILVNAELKRALTKIFITGKNYREQSRTVGGVSLQTFETDFGSCNIMLERAMPTDTLLVVSLEQCSPVFLNIPGKGHFFLEELAKTGASTKYQLYGEIGLKYGNEASHGKLTNVKR